MGTFQLDCNGRATKVLNTMGWGYQEYDPPDPKYVFPKCALPNPEKEMVSTTIYAYGLVNGTFSVYGSVCGCAWLADPPPGKTYAFTSVGGTGAGIEYLQDCPPDGAPMIWSHDFQGFGGIDSGPNACKLMWGTYTGVFQPAPGGCGGGCDGYGDSGTEDAVQAQSLEPMTPVDAGTVTVQGHANSFTGYGQHTTALAKELEKAGVPVRWVAYDRDDSFIPLDPWVAERIINL